MRQGTGCRAWPRYRQRHPSASRERNRRGEARAHRAGSRALPVARASIPARRRDRRRGGSHWGPAGRARRRHALGGGLLPPASQPGARRTRRNHPGKPRRAATHRGGGAVHLCPASCHRVCIPGSRVPSGRVRAAHVPPASVWRVRRLHGRACSGRPRQAKSRKPAAQPSAPIRDGDQPGVAEPGTSRTAQRGRSSDLFSHQGVALRQERSPGNEGALALATERACQRAET